LKTPARRSACGSRRICSSSETSIGGLRFEVPGRVLPYVFGAAGFARPMPTAQFTLSSGTLPDGTSPVLGTDVTNQLETSGEFTTPAASTAFMYSLGGGLEVPVARESGTGSRSGTGLRLARSHVRAQPEPPRTKTLGTLGNFRNPEGRSLFLVSPRRGLRARHNPGDVRIVAARAGVRFGSAPLLRFQPARGLLLLFFLFCALARPFILRGSRLLH